MNSEKKGVLMSMVKKGHGHENIVFHTIKNDDRIVICLETSKLTD